MAAEGRQSSTSLFFFFDVTCFRRLISRICFVLQLQLTERLLEALYQLKVVLHSDDRDVQLPALGLSTEATVIKQSKQMQFKFPRQSRRSLIIWRFVHIQHCFQREDSVGARIDVKSLDVSSDTLQQLIREYTNKRSTYSLVLFNSP